MITLEETHTEAQANATPDKMLDLLWRVNRWFKQREVIEDAWDWQEVRTMIRRLEMLSRADYYARHTLRFMYKLVAADLHDDPNADVPEENRTRTVRVFTGTSDGGVTIESDEPWGSAKVTVNLWADGLQVVISGPEIGHGYAALVATVCEDGLRIDRLHRSPKDADKNCEISNR
jgi:hypothetical protein